MFDFEVMRVYKPVGDKMKTVSTRSAFAAAIMTTAAIAAYLWLGAVRVRADDCYSYCNSDLAGAIQTCSGMPNDYNCGPCSFEGLDSCCSGWNCDIEY